MNQNVPQREKSGGGCWKVAGIGCLVVLGLGIAATIVIVLNFKTWTANIARAGIVQAINDSPLVPAQKSALIKEVDQLTDDFKEGRITVEELGKVGEALAEGPLIPMGMADVFNEHYVKGHGDLSDEEKKDAKIQTQRVARGVAEESIRGADVERIFDKMKIVKPDGTEEIKQSLSREELMEIVEECRTEADKFNIPNEEYKIDYAEEVKKAIDRALGR